MQPFRLANSRTERLDSLQALRAVAAIAVVLAHISQFETGGHAIHFFPQFFIGNVGVDLFFIISGFTMVYTTSESFGRHGAPIDFALRRIIRIVPMYWIVTAWVIWDQHAPGVAAALAKINSTFIHLLGSFLFIPVPRTDGTLAPIVLVGWTLNFEMYFYAVFAVALFSSRRLLALSSLSLFFLVSILISQFLQTDTHDLLATWTSPLILEFVFGMWLAVAYSQGLRISPIASGLMIAAGTAILYFEHSHGALGFARISDWGLASFLIIAAILLARTPLKGGVALRCMVLIGDASYVLYLTHLYVIGMPQWLLRLDPLTSPWIFAFASMALSISIAIALHFVLEKPLILLFRSLPALISKASA